MLKKFKTVITLFLLTISILPLIFFSSTFLFSAIDYFTKNDEKNILEILNRNKKYLEVFVDMNINQLKLIANSDDLRSYKRDEIEGVLKRFLNVRDEYSKIKYIDKDGWYIEVDRYKGIQYKRYDKLNDKEKILMEKGNFATSIKEDDKQYIVFSSKFQDKDRYGIVEGYIESKKLEFLFKKFSLVGLGQIIVEDSSGNLIYEDIKYKTTYSHDIINNIKNTDFTIIASINTEHIKRAFINDLFGKIILYLFLTVVMALVFSYLISDAVNRYINRVIDSVNTLKRIKSTNTFIDNIKEIELFRNKFNEIIEKISVEKNILDDKVNIDSLTHLYNKRFLIERLKDEINSSREDIYFMMVDIDYFKTINDTWGHLVGDKVLKALADILKENIREKDYAIRFGGEEFLLVFSEINKEKAILIAERIRKQVEDFVFKENDITINFTISIGVSRFKNSIDYTIDLSDEALYIAKKSGRNKVIYKEV